MSRFKKSSHVIWHCQYHLVWTPKCRFRILKDKVGREVYINLRILCEQLKIERVELNVQQDHVHLLVKISPKLSVSDVMGNHFGARGYCVYTVGGNAEMIGRYVKYQEKHELEYKQLKLSLM